MGRLAFLRGPFGLHHIFLQKGIFLVLAPLIDTRQLPLVRPSDQTPVRSTPCHRQESPGQPESQARDRSWNDSYFARLI